MSKTKNAYRRFLPLLVFSLVSMTRIFAGLYGATEN